MHADYGNSGNYMQQAETDLLAAGQLEMGFDSEE
jgi:hypothetical protein